MNHLAPYYWIPIFIFFWVAVSCLISLLGGWFALSKRFPPNDNIGSILSSFSWRSLNLNNIAGYSSCVNIKITEIGLFLKTSIIFSVLHKPIFIPWYEIDNLEYKSRFFKRVKFYVGKNRFVLFGKVAREICENIHLKKNEPN